MYNPIESGTDTTEFVELYNAESEAVDLEGYYFGEGFNFTFPEGAVIDAGAYMVLAGDSEGFTNYYGFAPDYEWTSGALSNGGEDIQLLNPIDAEVDYVDYDDGGDWPPEPDGLGVS